MRTSATSAHSKILILDFGSQYTQVIARRIRELQVYSEIVRFDTPAAEIAKLKPKGLILSGGPASVYDKDAPHLDPEIFSLDIPVLGICYGLMLMAHHLGGQVVFTGRREYGAGTLHIANGSQLLDGLGPQIDVWNSHGDEVTALPKGFRAAGRTESSNFAAVEDPQRKLYGLQFHPEVAHTPRGKEILQNFVYHICHCTMDWTMGSFIEEACARIREQVGEAGRRSKSRARFERRGRFVRYRGTPAPGDRGSAYLHFREQWFAALPRGRNRATGFRRKFPCASEIRGCE